MGLSDVISSTIFTISAALIATALVLTLSSAILGYGDSVSSSIGVLEEQSSTDIKIIHSFFENDTYGKVYVKNVGDLSISNYDQINVFIDGEIISNGELNITLIQDSSANSQWDFGDTVAIEIDLNSNLSPGDHFVKIVSPNGFDADEQIFSV